MNFFNFFRKLFSRKEIKENKKKSTTSNNTDVVEKPLQETDTAQKFNELYGLELKTSEKNSNVNNINKPFKKVETTKEHKITQPLYSTTTIANRYNITARPYLFDYLIKNHYIERVNGKYQLRKKGLSIGGQYQEKGTEKWIVWNEKKFVDVINLFKLDVLKQCNVFTINHMTHISNLKSIFEFGLLSHTNPYKKVDISNQEVNDRRNKKEPVYNRNIHQYVPFYFNPRNAMLYRNQHMFGNDIIILGFDNSIIFNNDFILTNSNAAVDNIQYTNDITDLFKQDFIDWEKVFSASWHDNGNPNYQVKQMMMAEVLIYQKVASNYIKTIYCQNDQTKQYLINNFLTSKIQIIVKPDIFF